MDKTYRDFIDFMIEKYSAEPDESVSLKDIKEFLNRNDNEISITTNEQDGTVELLSPEVRDFLRHYPNTVEDIGNRLYRTDLIICDKCGDVMHLIIHIDGSYEVYDRHWVDSKVRQELLVPQEIKTISDAREVFFFYENLV